MSRLLWCPVAASPTPYELAVGFSIRSMRDVLIVGPAPTAPAASSAGGPYMTVSVVNGPMLAFRGLVSSGSKRQSLFMGEFEPPEASGTLLITLERDGTE